LTGNSKQTAIFNNIEKLLWIIYSFFLNTHNIYVTLLVLEHPQLVAFIEQIVKLAAVNLEKTDCYMQMGKLWLIQKIDTLAR